jgi:ketosteroid isomerase-like protein
MTTDHDVPGAPLPADLVRHVHEYVSAFNSGDAAAIGRSYEADAVLVPRPGSAVTGPGRADATAHLMSYGLPMEAVLRHAYVAGDVALLVVDWAIRGTTHDGTPVEMAGSAADVVRRDAGGTWRYVVDNPFGTASLSHRREHDAG